jgi:hypothetical protein
VPSPAPAAPSVNEKGRVTHDDRGNAKWDLGLDTARVKKLTTSQLLKKLDLSELSLLDEELDLKAASGGGFQPYEPARSATGKNANRDPFRTQTGSAPKPGPSAGNRPTPSREPPKTKR